MTRPLTIPALADVSRDTPLRLDVAARVAFPDGSMTMKGLRLEATRDRLVIERVAGKDYTTLAHIERMRELCRVKVKAPASSSAPPDAMGAAASPIPPPGASSTDDISAALAVAHTIVDRLSKSSPNTSPRSGSRARPGNVIRLKSRSPK